MKYLVLIHLDEYVTEPPPEALLDAMVAHVADETHARVVTDAGLAPTAESIRVTPRGGKVTTTDGPFAEAKEVVGGFIMIDAPTREDAEAWTRGFVELHVANWPEIPDSFFTELRQVAGSLSDPE